MAELKATIVDVRDQWLFRSTVSGAQYHGLCDYNNQLVSGYAFITLKPETTLGGATMAVNPPGAPRGKLTSIVVPVPKYGNLPSLKYQFAGTGKALDDRNGPWTFYQRSPFADPAKQPTVSPSGQEKREDFILSMGPSGDLPGCTWNQKIEKGYSFWTSDKQRWAVNIEPLAHDDNDDFSPLSYGKFANRPMPMSNLTFRVTLTRVPSSPYVAEASLPKDQQYSFSVELTQGDLGFGGMQLVTPRKLSEFELALAWHLEREEAAKNSGLGYEKERIRNEDPRELSSYSVADKNPPDPAPIDFLYCELSDISPDGSKAVLRLWTDFRRLGEFTAPGGGLSHQQWLPGENRNDGSKKAYVSPVSVAFLVLELGEEEIELDDGAKLVRPAPMLRLLYRADEVLPKETLTDEYRPYVTEEGTYYTYIGYAFFPQDHLFIRNIARLGLTVFGVTGNGLIHFDAEFFRVPTRQSHYQTFHLDTARIVDVMFDRTGVAQPVIQRVSVRADAKQTTKTVGRNQWLYNQAFPTNFQILLERNRELRVETEWTSTLEYAGQTSEFKMVAKGGYNEDWKWPASGFPPGWGIFSGQDGLVFPGQQPMADGLSADSSFGFPFDQWDFEADTQYKIFGEFRLEIDGVVLTNAAGKDLAVTVNEVHDIDLPNTLIHYNSESVRIQNPLQFFMGETKEAFTTDEIGALIKPLKEKALLLGSALYANVKDAPIMTGPTFYLTRVKNRPNWMGYQALVSSLFAPGIGSFGIKKLSNRLYGMFFAPSALQSATVYGDYYSLSLAADPLKGKFYKMLTPTGFKPANPAYDSIASTSPNFFTSPKGVDGYRGAYSDLLDEYHLAPESYKFTYV